MNYFDGINAIRDELQQEKNEKEEADADCKDLTRAIVQRTREK